jgi:peptidoglycan/xylan/chitin deacetylase (PgdA/CDA1 family)
VSRLLSPLLQGLSSVVGGRGPECKLQILIYHRVLNERDALQPSEPTAAEFNWQMELLARHFNPLPLADALDRMQRGNLPPRAVCVTFDDGYRDNLTLALPILDRHGVPATVFVATGFLGGGIMFNDAVLECLRQYPGATLDLSAIGLDADYPLQDTGSRRASFRRLIGQLKYLPAAERDAQVERLVAHTGAALPTDLMMTPEEVAALHRSGVEIGAHTVHHPILLNLEEAQAREEIAQSRAYLQDLLDAPVRVFAYPNGVPGRDYSERDARLVKQLGFAGAVSTASGHSTGSTSPYELRRFTPWDSTPTRFHLRLLRNYL